MCLSVRESSVKKPTIFEALMSKLGRVPTSEEVKADVKRILSESLVSQASKGNLSFQKRRRK